jgi:hypothetical protein
MGALTSTVPTKTGVVWTPAAVAASDTVSAAQLGSLGAYLVVINGNASPDSVGYTDPGVTPASGAAAAFTNSVANATTEVMYLSPKLLDPTALTLTITHSVTSSVTYVLIPIG